MNNVHTNKYGQYLLESPNVQWHQFDVEQLLSGHVDMLCSQFSCVLNPANSDRAQGGHRRLWHVKADSHIHVVKEPLHMLTG